MVLGLASSGLHSNGYSLVRKIVFEHAGLKVTDFIPELGRTVGEELLEPTRIYVRPVHDILRHYPVKRRVVRGLAHITGEGLEARFDWNAWALPPVFQWLQETGGVADPELRRTFNCGVGLVLIVEPDELPDVLEGLVRANEDAFVIGELAKAP